MKPSTYVARCSELHDSHSPPRSICPGPGRTWAATQMITRMRSAPTPTKIFFRHVSSSFGPTLIFYRHRQGTGEYTGRSPRFLISMCTSHVLTRLPLAGGPPFRLLSSLSPFDAVGAPSLRFCKGGYDAADTMALSCLAVCIALTVRITCTLSLVLAIGDCFFLKSAAQEMNMFRHHDIPNDYEAVPLGTCSRMKSSRSRRTRLGQSE